MKIIPLFDNHLLNEELRACMELQRPELQVEALNLIDIQHGGNKTSFYIN